MRKFITNLSKFFLGFVVFIITPILVISNFDNTDRNTSNNNNIVSLREKAAYNNLDVLFLGNSYCYSAVDPSILETAGIKSYNLGVSTAGVEFYEILLDDYLVNAKSQPKVIFILVSPMTFSSKADNYSLYPIHRYLDEPLSNLEVAIKFGHYNRIFPMYRKSTDKGLTHLLSLEQEKRKPLNPDRGFISFDSNITVNKSVIKETEDIYAPLLKEKFNKKKIKNLLNLSKKSRSNGMKVVYFELPTYKLKDYFSEDYLNEYQTSLEILEKEDCFLKIDENLFSTKNFRNTDHMNSSGAAIATKEIIKFIDKKELLKP